MSEKLVPGEGSRNSYAGYREALEKQEIDTLLIWEGNPSSLKNLYFFTKKMLEIQGKQFRSFYNDNKLYIVRIV